jgi:hypothetical protein
MDARWMPVMAAALGVLGGVGGAFVGGSVANSGQSQQFQSEREAQKEDLRLATYSKYVGAVDVFIVKVNLAGQRFGFTETAAAEINEFVQQEALDVFSAAAAVELLADTDVRSAAETLRNALTSFEGEPDWDYWNDLRSDFIEQARIDVEASG